jgi:prephenate dehydrogenase
MTRLALSGWDIWRDILETNRDEIVRAIGFFEQRLRALATELEQGLPEDDFRRGAEFASRLREGR